MFDSRNGKNNPDKQNLSETVPMSILETIRTPAALLKKTFGSEKRLRSVRWVKNLWTKGQRHAVLKFFFFDFAFKMKLPKANFYKFGADWLNKKLIYDDRDALAQYFGGVDDTDKLAGQLMHDLYTKLCEKCTFEPDRDNDTADTGLPVSDEMLVVNFKRFLLNRLNYVHLNIFKDKKRSEVVIDSLVDHTHLTVDFSVETLSNLSGELRKGLMILSRTERKVITLKVFYGFSHAEIAVRSDITEKTSRKAFSIGMAKLRRWLLESTRPDVSGRKGK